jgi:ATP-dependent DNA ligase
MASFLNESETNQSQNGLFRRAAAIEIRSVATSTNLALEIHIAPIKRSPSSRARKQESPLPSWIRPQLTQLSAAAPSGAQWLHEIKLDGFRMAAHIECGEARLLTRTGLDWTEKHPSVVAALSKVAAKTAYLDGELCGVGDDGLPSFSQTQAASDGEPGVRLVYYALIFCIWTVETPPVCRSSSARPC